MSLQILTTSIDSSR